MCPPSAAMQYVFGMCYTVKIFQIGWANFWYCSIRRWWNLAPVEPMILQYQILVQHSTKVWTVYDGENFRPLILFFYYTKYCWHVLVLLEDVHLFSDATLLHSINGVFILLIVCKILNFDVSNKVIFTYKTAFHTTWKTLYNFVFDFSTNIVLLKKV